MRRFRGYYPIFVDLREKACLVVGGGLMAQQKVKSLLRCGARVTVVSSTVTPGLARAAAAGKIRRIARMFQERDLRGVWLVWSASDNAKIDADVLRHASRHRIFTNAPDQPSRCSFITPAVVRRGCITAAVSTGGASSTVAKRVREEVGQAIGDVYPKLAGFFDSLRPTVGRRLKRYEDRQRYYESLMRGRSAGLVRSGDLRGARAHALRRLMAQADSRS